MYFIKTKFKEFEIPSKSEECEILFLFPLLSFYFQILNLYLFRNIIFSKKSMF